MRIQTIIEVKFMERHADNNVSKRLGFKSSHIRVTNFSVAFVVTTVNDIDEILRKLNHFFLGCCLEVIKNLITKIAANSKKNYPFSTSRYTLTEENQMKPKT